ncbi:MAG: tetratricopeptide repeat protein [Mariprofundus sp.]
MSELWHAILLSALSLWLLSGCAALHQPLDPTEGALQAQADAVLSQGKNRDALYYYQAILKKTPKDRTALIHSGHIYLDIGLPELAEDYFKRVLEGNPADAEALEGLGISRIKLHHYAPARLDLQRAVLLDSKRWNGWNGLGIIADIGGDYGKAGEFYRKGLTVLPHYPPLINNLGYSQMMAHHYREAEETLRSGLKYAPDSHWLKNNLGMALAWQGDYQGGVKAISAAIGEAAAYNNVGYIALLKEDYQKAASCFESAMQSSPNYYLRAAQNLKRVQQLIKAHSADE